MPAKRGIGPVLKSSSIMEQTMIVHKLHITWLKTHEKVQCGIVGHRIKTIQRFDMGRRQSHGFIETLRRINILALIDTGHEACVPIKDRDLKEGF